MLRFGMIEGIIKEGKTQLSYYRNIKAALTASLKRLEGLSEEELLKQRYEKFRKVGVFMDNTPE